MVDVPVFSLETREDILKGIGISRSMLDYYNIQLSGSHPFFPRFEEADILGKDVQLQF